MKKIFTFLSLVLLISSCAPEGSGRVSDEIPFCWTCYFDSKTDSYSEDLCGYTQSDIYRYVRKNSVNGYFVECEQE